MLRTHLPHTDMHLPPLPASLTAADTLYMGQLMPLWVTRLAKPLYAGT
jgi:hypothetical protein